MKLKQSWMVMLAIALLVAVAFTFNPIPVFADNDQEPPSFISPAQEEIAKNLAELTEASVDDIAAMRASGMGWGEIAIELGIDPRDLFSALGLGHYRSREMTEATARNQIRGLPGGHGIEAGGEGIGGGAGAGGGGEGSGGGEGGGGAGSGGGEGGG
ncbi:hypothetical protein KAR91_80020, partial [Candidatus Pacearchaeota archaeon]|nr:hypothetical protein [Candidatus Pacearchaeota archaeon]